MADKEYVSYYINLTSSEKSTKDKATTKFAWRAPVNAYPADIAKELGVNKASEKEVGLIYGMNYPRPVRVRVNVKAKQGSSKSVVLFCSPATLSKVLVAETLKGKTFRDGKITTVSTIGSSTNPRRSKNGTGKSKNRTKTNGKTNGVRPSTNGVRPSTNGVRPSTNGVRPSTNGVRPSTNGTRKITRK